MVGSSSRLDGHDRFYQPPHVRQQLQLQQRRQKEEEQQQVPAAPAPQKVKTRHRLQPSTPSCKEVSAVRATTTPSCKSNLEQFITFTTPFVVPQCFPRSRLRGHRGTDCAAAAEDAASQPYYILGDLWESYNEWSVYGAEVPLVLNDTDKVVQYYVPFLSAIQLFVDKSKPDLGVRRQIGEESDAEVCLYSSSSSDASSEGDSEQFIEQRREPLNSGCIDQEGFSSDDNCDNNQPRLPIFEYFEYDPPYGRQPLANKISALASKFPALRTYRSCDLLPASWMSVAWYPIYRIPTGPTLQDLDACFLTFHPLSALSNGAQDGHHEVNGLGSVARSRPGVSGKLPLPLIGLASYKVKSSIWTSKGQNGEQLATGLLREAEKWLSSHQVVHPDFRFFVTRYTSPR